VVASGSSGSGSTSVSLNRGRVDAFFEPVAGGIARDAEGSRQPAQASALLVSTEDFLALLFSVAVGLGVLAAVLAAGFAQKALFAKRCLLSVVC
jgi:hypothetical protein